MPHCIIEYASSLCNDISVSDMVKAVHQGAVNSALFDSTDIKTRAIPYDHYFAENEKQRFIHVCVRILSGRTEHQRKRLSQHILHTLDSHALNNISITIEITDIDLPSYAKQVNQ